MIDYGVNMVTKYYKLLWKGPNEIWHNVQWIYTKENVIVSEAMPM